MRILAGTDDGLTVIRWIEGERSGRAIEKHFEGRQVYRLAATAQGIWAVVPEEGIFRSQNRGDSWERVAERLGGAMVRSLTASARRPVGDLRRYGTRGHVRVERRRSRLG